MEITKLVPVRRTAWLLEALLFASVASGSSVRLRAVTESKSPSSQHNEHRQLQEQLLEDQDGDGIPDSLQLLEDQDGDGIPDWIDLTMPDWSNFDWSNVDWTGMSSETIDWSNIAWTPQAWGDFLQGLLGDTATTSLDFCPILESAVGMGNSFGIAGKCLCEGSLGDGLSIDCNFEECVDSLACGSIGLNFTFDDATGLVKTNACMNTTAEKYEEVCFSYQLEMSDSANVFDLDRTCEASYGGKPCDCVMEGLCLAIDCSAYLPGAKMDTCQYLAFEEAGDATSLMPRFPIFNETFDGMFAFESINWTNLDWENLDWDNFGFDRVNWTDVDWSSTQWGSLFGNGMLQDQICPILSSEVLGMSDDVFGGGCSCTGEVESGFNILCSFGQQCVPTTPVDEVAVAKMDTSSLEYTICGDVAVDLTFDNVGSVSGNLCVDFADDIHPITCIDYAIPIADQETQPTCDATYGGEPCKCSIDESLCVKVDCSVYEPTATMDTCQLLALTKQDDIENLVPRFGIPSPVEANTETELTLQEVPQDMESDGEPIGSVVSQSNEAAVDKSSAASFVTSATVVIVAILSIMTL